MNKQFIGRPILIRDALVPFISSKLNLTGMEIALLLQWKEIFPEEPLSNLSYKKFKRPENVLVLKSSNGAVAVSAQYLKSQIIERIQSESQKFGYIYEPIKGVQIVQKNIT